MTPPILSPSRHEARSEAQTEAQTEAQSWSADGGLQEISHRRFNPLRGSWLLVSPHRTKRPWLGQEEPPAGNSLAEYDAECSLCPGNTRAKGDRTPHYENLFVFINDFSAVQESQPAEYHESRADLDPSLGHSSASNHAAAASASAAAALLRAEPITGRCYVMTFSAKHHLTLADMSAREVLPVIEAWTALYHSHLAPANPLAACAVPSPACGLDLPRPPARPLRYMQIFENKGAAMGCSNPHPHCQVWTTSALPEEPGLELASMTRYRAEHGGRHLLGDYVELEVGRAERVVWQGRWWVVVCPWWAVWPFEVLVLPRRHVRALVDLTEDERLGLAEAIQEVTRRYDNLFACSFPYSSGIHQAPLDGTDDEIESSYLHLHFYPPLIRSATVRKFLVGFELLAEPQRDITPEQAAVRLRGCGGELYRRDISNPDR